MFSSQFFGYSGSFFCVPSSVLLILILVANFYRMVYIIASDSLHPCVLQGGAPIRALSRSVFNFLCGIKPSDLVGIDEVPATDVRELLNRVKLVSVVFFL